MMMAGMAVWRVVVGRQAVPVLKARSHMQQSLVLLNAARSVSTSHTLGFPRRKVVEPTATNAMNEDVKQALKGTSLEHVDDFRFLYRLLYPGEVPANYQDLVTVDAVKDELRYLFPSCLSKPEFEPIAKRVPLEQLSTDCVELDSMFRPNSAAHFTGNPKFYTMLCTLEDLFAMLNHKLPPSAAKSVDVAAKEPPRWLSHGDMELALGEAFTEELYEELTQMMTEVYYHPLFEELGMQTLKPYMTESVDKTVAEVQAQLDNKGRAHAVGKRKTSVARVWVWPESGAIPKIKVNGKPVAEFFGDTDKLLAAIAPLRRLNIVDQFSVMCNVHGGGVTGQADAVALGISKALVTLRPELRPELERGEFLIRDSRTVEPKKAGQRKARRKFQWVKR